MMKTASIVFLSSVFSWLSMSVAADEPVDQSEILAQRGKGIITYQQFSARADKIPADKRFSTLRSGKRLQDVLASMLLRFQLAADAREAGFDKEQIVIDRMKLAADFELAEAWINHYVEMQPDADYEQLAFEYFQLNKSEIMSSPKIDVSHILVSSRDRSDEEAKALADSIYQKISENPSSFDALVVEYSEDPSASSNKGKFLKVKKGDMVMAFEAAAFAMEPEEISEPVKTEFGYHIIRLDAYYEPENMQFADVKEQLIEIERKKHDERIKKDYLESLTALDVQMSKAQLEEMVRRQFGEEMIGSEGKDGN